MAIVEMKKMHLLGLRKEQDKILSILQKAGKVEIIEVIDEPDRGTDNDQIGLDKELSEFDQKLTRLKFGIDFLKPYVQEKNPLLYGKPRVNEQEVKELLSDGKLIDTKLDDLYELDQRFSHLKAEESKLNSRIELMSIWQQMDIPVEQLGNTQKAVFLPLVVSKKELEGFKTSLSDMKIESHIFNVSESRDDAYMLLVFLQEQKDEVQELIKQYSVNVQDFPGLAGTPQEIVENDRRRLLDIEKEREQIRQASAELADYRFKFEILYDYWSLERDKKAGIQKVVQTDKAFYLTAWVPKPNAEQVKQKITNSIEAVCINFTDPGEDEQIPVVLSNPRIVQPFEMITELYSLPDPKGIDPNIFMAPFYFVFFGMMVSDAGYGLVLSILMGIAMWKLKLAGMGKKLVELLFLGGISTFIWGAIFGGWFGDLIKLKPLWLNPLDDPMTVLVVSFIFGIIQIYSGLLLSAYKNIRDGHSADAFMDQGMWIIFLSGLIMLAFPQLRPIAKYVAIVGAVGLLLTQGRSQKGIIKKFTSGLLSLYDVTGYLSDVLSYSRLLALGLATGVIGTVINTMAKLVGVNIIGVILMVIIMIGGHIFNIAINVLGAYVHSSRLQYIEFFGKFYDSGGRAFDPLKIRTTFVEFEDI
jgi:V/A-type H+-transporting ATPase subunit I